MRSWIYVGLVAATFFSAQSQASADDTKLGPKEKPVVVKKAEEEKRPTVEAVFVLDTTGSMSGLINAAKQRIWAIANTLARSKPAPRIKLGLVGFRDRGDAYITTLTKLTDDLDAVYSKLMGFSAGGGGDGPESVNQGLHEAVTKFEWSKKDDCYRVIFLVGDAPPHMDYARDVKYMESCKLAVEKGLVVNTVQCGNDATTTKVWRDIAALGEGKFFAIAQSGGHVIATTPFDKELADLSSKLDATRLYFGSKKEQVRQQKRRKVADEIAEKASVAANAQRGMFNCGKGGYWNWAGASELIAALQAKKVKLEDIKTEELPKEMRTMTLEQRKEYVKKRLTRRAELQEKIKAVAAKRATFLKEEMKKSAKEPAFEKGVFDCLKEQAAKRGIIYKDGPSF